MPYSAPSFGVLASGFVRKLSSDVFLDMQSAARTNVDANLDTSPTEPIGQVLGAMADSVGQCWEVLDTLYSMGDPNQAEGFLLDGVCALTGTKRPGATFGHVVVTMNLNMSTTVNAGLVANVSGQPSNTWKLIGPADTNGNLIAPGPIVATTAGNYSSFWQCTQTGPIVANASTLTVVPSPPAGLNTITNPADAILGSNADTDTQLRILRAEEIAASGGGTVDGIRAAVLEVPGLAAITGSQVFVFQNETDTQDSFGRPPHSVEVVVFDGPTPNHTLDNAIAQAMWNVKTGGIPFYSATGDNGTATDSLGNTHIVPFSRAIVQNIYVTATATPTATSGTAPAIKAAYAAWAAKNVGLGTTLYALAFRAAVIDGPYAVASLLDIPTFAFDVHSSPTNTGNLVAGQRTYFYVQSGNITVDGF